MLLRELEPEKYWSFPASYTKEKRDAELQKMIMSNNYYWQLKTDGNYSAFICDFDNDQRIISRGISKTTHEYGVLSDKLFFFDRLKEVFTKPTRIMGEIWLEGGVDKNVGSILRAAPEKAKSIQDDGYYQAAKQYTKFTAKDKRDIEQNEFRNQKLKWRIFDIWYYDGIDLTNTPWIERQEYVKLAAERLAHPLITAVPYHEMTLSFYDELAAIFEAGGEGVVCYNKNGLPEPGKRTAHKTLKVKREISNNIDAFIIGVEPPTKLYTGKELGNWIYWENSRSGEKQLGELFGEYQMGAALTPVTKNYFHNYPGAIIVGVYDNDNNIYSLCKVSGLTDDFKIELRDNFKRWYMCPVSIGGMALSTSDGLSIRHPHLVAIRENDIDPKDCTLKKILS